MEEEINCHLCKGKAQLKFEELKLDEGRILIRESPYYECKCCGEEFATSEQMAELSGQINTKFCFEISEKSLAKDWLSKKEKEAWKDL